MKQLSDREMLEELSEIMDYYNENFERFYPWEKDPDTVIQETLDEIIALLKSRGYKIDTTNSRYKE